MAYSIYCIPAGRLAVGTTQSFLFPVPAVTSLIKRPGASEPIFWSGNRRRLPSAMVSRAVFVGSERDPRFLQQRPQEPFPPLEDGEILVKIRLALLCDSDIRAATSENGLCSGNPIPRWVLVFSKSYWTTRLWYPGQRSGISYCELFSQHISNIV